MPSKLAHILASPCTPLLAGAAFLGSVAILPISMFSPSTAGRDLFDLFNSLRGHARPMRCIFPYHQQWYMLNNGRFAPASDQLVQDAPPKVTLVLASLDTYPSGRSGVWGLTHDLTTVRVTVDTVGLTTQQAVALRRQFIDEMAAASVPVIFTHLPAIYTSDIRESRILWQGYLHNAASLGSFALFTISAPLAIRRLYRNRRASRGLCPHCRYDLRGLQPGTPCPECGTVFNDNLMNEEPT